MYVALSEARPFTPRELRRLEALGEQLTLQLDNAKQGLMREAGSQHHDGAAVDGRAADLNC